jgi:hypothetical protein
MNVKKIRSHNPLNAELNPICHLLALLRGATIVVVSRLRVKLPGTLWATSAYFGRPLPFYINVINNEIKMELLSAINTNGRLR